MKNFLKSLSKKSNLVIIAIFFFAFLTRFYNFPNRITFWTEQAESLITSGNYVKEKFSLLGQEYFRQDSNAHIIYSGAIFNYSLVPLLLIFNYNPIPITGYFVILNIFTGCVIFWTVRKMFGKKMAILSTFLFLFNDYMIYHSLFIWNYNYLPLIGILILYLTYNFIKNKNNIDIFLVGILCGIGISFQILFFPIAIIFFLINIWESKNLFHAIVLFALGLIIGNLPMVLFDIRHGFYETKTLLQYLIDTLHGKSGASFSYYYLLPLWPMFSIIGAWFIIKSRQINKFVPMVILMVYLFINMLSPKIEWNEPTGMPKGLNVGDVALASRKISQDTKGNFNVAEVLDFDKRAYVLRYYLQFKENINPDDVTSYPNAKVLYALSKKGYSFAKSDIWEIQSANLDKIVKLTDVGNGYAIYKLTK